MNIKLTKEQYEKLIDLAYLGNWVINAYRTDDFREDYNDVAEYIYTFAPSFGIKGKVDFDESEGRGFPSRRLEEEMADFIDDYDDWSFWDLLTLKLGERDLVREYGESVVDQMPETELTEKRAPHVKKYEKEIDEHGIENLEIYKIS